MCPYCTQSLDSVYWSDLFIENDRDIDVLLYFSFFFKQM